MQEAVSAILIDRARETDGLSRMVLVSLVAHGALLALVVLMPESWRSHARPEEATMMISLAGTNSPKIEGMTATSSRSVETTAPPESKADVRPPEKPPEMVLPSPKAKVVPKAPPKSVDKATEKSASRTPTSGAEIRTGAAPVNRECSTAPSA